MLIWLYSPYPSYKNTPPRTLTAYPASDYTKHIDAG